MINHYLLTLTPEQESRVLTGKMAPGTYMVVGTETRCLVGTAAGAFRTLSTGFGSLQFQDDHCYAGWAERDFPVERRYDWLCARFGDERVNTAIRNRILANQAWRALTPVREMATVCGS